MAYTALYRRLRPKLFEDVIGQRHITRTLINEIKTDTMSHAYLFCGTRGTGKTSTAKIFAKAVNCLDLKDGEPCGKCQLCVSADDGSSTNVTELDAASHNGVDNIREIRDEVKYPPVLGKYKVYIIDEVHMLSTGAFNALLKTLEEPPAHIIFVLATTDPQKIPVTILSRCQRFDFRRITPKDVADSLKRFTESEGLNVTDDAIFYIANLCEGAMRDALTLLDRCLAYCFGEEITLEKVLDICGSVDNEVFFKITNALASFNGKECINIIAEIYDQGRDIVRFSAELVTHLRNVLVSVQSDNDGTFPEETYKRYREQAKKVSVPLLIKYIGAFSELNASMKISRNPRTLFEVECVRLCNAFDNNTVEDIFLKLKKLETLIASGNFATAPPEPTAVKKSEEVRSVPMQLRSKAVPEDVEKIQREWASFADSFENPMEKQYLKVCPADTLEDGKIYIVCPKGNHKKYLSERADYISEQLAKYFGTAYNIDFILREDFDAKNQNILSSTKAPDMEELKNRYKPKVNFDINYTE